MLVASVMALAGAVVATNTVTIFLPNTDPFPSWQGEVHGIDATATTYLIHCAGPFNNQCAFRPNLTVTQGPATLAYADTPLDPWDSPLEVHCNLPADTALPVTCPNSPGYTFTLAYAGLNPQLVEITRTTWYAGPPTATPTGRDPATASLLGSGTAQPGRDCGGAIFCGGFIGPAETGASGAGYGNDGDSSASSASPAPAATDATGPAPDWDAEFSSAVAAVTTAVTDLPLPASDIVGVIPVYTGGTLVVFSDAAAGLVTVSLPLATSSAVVATRSAKDDSRTTEPATAYGVVGTRTSGAAGAASSTAAADGGAGHSYMGAAVCGAALACLVVL
ncbi:hypothetical protein FH972_023623 [Carpinus fangiana]|uniref:Phytocyanin domain-containing protein n=1 Tax=Carpinus fangiana TaxID=176857 RepID=A0A5N6KW77_9ROSI|nr:hypothetical protein FH972_023623 [Carpinus fangiana]